MLEGIGNKVVATVVGFLRFIVWVEGKSLLGCYGDGGEWSDRIPEVVLDGGGQQVVMDVDLNAPGHVDLTVELPDERSFSAREELDAGSFSIPFEVPPNAYWIAELQIDEPQVGDELSWVLKVDGKVEHRRSDRLEEPLKEGYGFFLQIEHEPRW